MKKHLNKNLNKDQITNQTIITIPTEYQHLNQNISKNQHCQSKSQSKSLSQS